MFGEAPKKPDEYVVPPAMKLWDYLKAISEKRELSDDDLRGYNPFIINKQLSMVHHYLPLIRKHANNSILLNDKRTHYNLMCALIPNKFVKYPAMPKKTVDIEERNNVFRLLSINLKIGFNDIREMEKFRGYEYVKSLAEKYMDRNKK